MWQSIRIHEWRLGLQNRPGLLQATGSTWDQSRHCTTRLTSPLVHAVPMAQQSPTRDESNIKHLLLSALSGCSQAQLPQLQSDARAYVRSTQLTPPTPTHCESSGLHGHWRMSPTRRNHNYPPVCQIQAVLLLEVWLAQDRQQRV